MIAYLKYRYNIARLLRKREQIHADYGARIQRTRKEGNSGDEIDALIHEWFDQKILCYHEMGGCALDTGG
jgi:hypothetical protein